MGLSRDREIALIHVVIHVVDFATEREGVSPNPTELSNIGYGSILSNLNAQVLG
jgi:hypothetical protein